MRILLLFSQPWNVGGAETHVTDLVKSLSEKGHQIFMIIHGANKADRLLDFTENQWLVDFRSSNPLKYLRLGNQIIDIVKENQIDIIHAHQRTSGYLAAFIKYKLNIPFVVTVHDPWKRALFKSLHARIFDNIITVSDFLRNHFICEFGFSPERVHTVYNGADQTRYNPEIYADRREEYRKSLGIASNSKVVSLIARLYTSKGHQYLIQAAPAILKQVPETKFLFVGSGDHEKKFRDMIRELGLQKAFIFTGYREDIPEMIAASDLVVRPSDMEGLPINLIEAMLMEKPVIATAIAGVPEMIIPGENGYMIAPGDYSKLAEYIVSIFLNPIQAVAMGAAGRKISLEKFTLQALVEKTEKLYRSLISPKKIKLE